MLDVERILNLHAECVRHWHMAAIHQPYPGVYGTICEQHAFNFQLWHEEDQARCPDADDAVIAGVKRRIDRLNQQRNDWIEKIDDELTRLLALGNVVPREGASQNSETAGSVCDRLSILALRIYHLQEQRNGEPLAAALRDSLDQKLKIALAQRSDLAIALQELLSDLWSGAKRHRTYRQLKLYNDPNFNPYLAANRPSRWENHASGAEARVSPSGE